VSLPNTQGVACNIFVGRIRQVFLNYFLIKTGVLLWDYFANCFGVIESEPFCSMWPSVGVAFHLNISFIGNALKTKTGNLLLM
jgi:hypothetical protein